ncbi:hypothetical protein GCM10009111_23880 [Colwellia asteriadis]|uniref:UPF0033 domain-containing protein n=1 Tax=Colwellia asteriadis TaxID=517723 RepID=A0ABN1L8G9_9GAMM
MIYSYDGTRERCPIPLVQTRLLLKKMREGDYCQLQLKDSGSIQDIPKLLSKLGYSYTQHKNKDDVVEITINNKLKE